MASLFTINPDGSLSITLPPPILAGKIPAGLLATLPATPAAGDTFVALDQPTGQQLYVCGKSGQWNQMVNLGGSGALKVEGGSLDINLATMPMLSRENSFTGLNHFTGDVDFQGKVTGVSGAAAKIWFGAKSAIAQPVAARVDATLGFETYIAGSTPGVQTSPTQFTIPANGIYHGYAQIRSIPAVMGASYLSIRRNGQEIAFSGWAGGTLGGPALQTVFSLPLLKNDVLTAVASSWTAFTIDGAAFVCET